MSHVIENPKKATGCAIVTYFDDGSRKFIFHMGNTPAVEAKAPQKDVLDGVRYFHVMGCSLFADIEFAKEILKDNEFRLIILHTFEGLSLVEIAKSLNKNESTIRWQYNNGLKKLRKELERRNK